MHVLKDFFHSLGYYFKGIYDRTQEEDVMFMASGLAFNGIFCLIPLLLLLTSVLGIFLSSSYLALNQVDEVLWAAFPSQPYAATIRATIRQMLVDIIQYRTSFGLIGMGILTWTATSLFSATRTILNRIYKSKTDKLVILHILEDLLWVVLVGVLFVITSVFPWLMSIINSIVNDIPALQNLHVGKVLEFLPGLVTLILTFLMFFILYRYIPDHGVTMRTAAVSAITTTILWMAIGKVFGWYLSTFHSFTKLYGAYAFLLAFIFWVYYSSVVFIIGAIVGQLYKQKRKEHHHG